MAPGDVNSTDRVEIRAFRGNRRTSVYRSYLVPRPIFERILTMARTRGLALLSSFERSGSRDLDKRQARSLAKEATALRMSGELADVDDDLTSIAELARWCARTSGDAWVSLAFGDPE